MTKLSLNDFLTGLAVSPLSRLMNVQEQTFWPTYLSALVLAAGVYMVTRRRSSLRGLLRYLGPRKLFRTASTWLDFKMYVFSSLYLVIQAATVFAGMGSLSAGLLHLLERVLGPAAADEPLPQWANIVVPIMLYMAMELGYWVAHWLMHRIPWLWEFHKVHHSAEVMTPLTEWRQHPVEFFLVPLGIGVATALVMAPMQWLLGRHMTLGSLWSPGLILLIFSMTIVHLRHSHVKLNAPGWLGYIIQSPQHHHIHHSTDPAHFDRNFGFCLSVWDWVFGTLALPSKSNRIVFGLYDETGARDELATSSSLRRHLWLPIVRASRWLRPNRPGQTSHMPAE